MLSFQFGRKLNIGNKNWILKFISKRSLKSGTSHLIYCHYEKRGKAISCGEIRHKRKSQLSRLSNNFLISIISFDTETSLAQQNHDSDLSICYKYSHCHCYRIWIHTFFVDNFSLFLLQKKVTLKISKNRSA